jgi:hypothetical protein
MFNSTILEVAIGLAFVYLLLSLICSAVVEMIGALPFTNWRGRALDVALENLFRKLWKDELKQHPLIQGTPPITFGGGLNSIQSGEFKKPDYIEPKNFVNALINILETRGGNAGLQTAIQNLLITDATGQTIQSRPELENAKKLLLSLYSTADRDLSKFRTELENWFKTEMERINAWYRRWTVLWLAAAAMMVTLSLNVDTISVAESLWNNPKLRQTVVANAEQNLNDLATATQTLKTEVREQCKTDTDPKACDAVVKKLNNMIKTSSQALTTLDLPIAQKPFWEPPTDSSDLVTFWFKHVGGLLITIIMVSLGAPFWFDTLNRLVNVRLSGKTNSDETQKEKSKP